MTEHDKLAVAREALAELEHLQWLEWAENLLTTERHLSSDRVERWRSLFVPYAELSEEMKEHDRRWARLALDVLADALAAARAQGAAEAFEKAAKECEMVAIACDETRKRLEDASAEPHAQIEEISKCGVALKLAAAIRALAREAAK